MTPSNKRQDKTAYVVGLFGATGTGKSTRAAEIIAQMKPARRLVWDFKGEDNYTGAEGHFSRVSDLHDAIKAKGRRGRFYFAFRPAMDDKVRDKQFQAVNSIVRAYGNMLYIVEEMRFITKPSAAPVSWSLLTMTGREQGIKIIGTSQRPASVDKDFFSNCTHIHSRRLNFDADIVAMAGALRIRREQMAALKGHDYYERDLTTGELTEKKF